MKEKASMAKSICSFGCGAFVASVAWMTMLGPAMPSSYQFSRRLAVVGGTLTAALLDSLIASLGFLLISRELNSAGHVSVLFLLGCASASISVTVPFAVRLFHFHAPMFLHIAAVVVMVCLPSIVLPIVTLGYAKERSPDDL